MAYPNTVDTISSPSAGSRASSPTELATAQAVATAANAIMAELGATPSGSSATVAARLDAMDSAQAETIRDTIGSTLVAGTNVTITVDDTANTITIAASGGSGGGLTTEEVQDAVAALIVAGTGITATYNDAANTLTLATSVTQYTDEMAQDAVAGALAAGTHTGITVTYNDTSNSLSLANSVTQYTDEMARDAVGAALVAGTNVTITVDDPGNTITIAAAGGGSGGAANLSYTAGATNGVVVSDTGTDATLPLADGTNAGLMAPAQHTKLAGIESGATADQTAAEILAALVTVDGSGSGLDADTLRGTTPTAAGLAILDDADAAAQRTTLGVDYTTLDERARDALGSALTAGTGIAITPNDGADTITVAVSGLTQTQVAPGVVALTDGATVTLDASLGRTFRVTLGGNRTLAITNPTDGQVIELEIIQDATGSRTLTLPASVRFSSSAPSSLYVLSATAGKRDYLTLKYNTASAKWDAVGFLPGF